MACRSALGTFALATTLTMAAPGAEAFDEARYPDFASQWIRVGDLQWDPSKPPGLGQQAPLGMLGQRNLRMILFEKFGQHQPLNRQSERYRREGIDLSVSTLADQVGACTTVLQPLHALIERHVLAAERLHGDDTIVPILAKGKTIKGHIWTYVRDGRPFGGRAPPAALYYASRDRRHEHPARHLHGFNGILQADAYSGYNELYNPSRTQGPITAALCWAHARRQFFELADIAANARRGKNAAAISPIALEAVKRIDALFDIERGINGQSAEQRLRVRKEQSAPLVAALETWLREQRSRLSSASSVAGPIDYMLRRWDRFVRFLHDGRICLTNNAAERALRGFALGRKSWLFAGSDEGASYCPSDNLLINQADFAADREMTGVETCGFWRPAGCPHVRYLSPEPAMARRGMDDRRAGHLRRSCAVLWTGLPSTPEPLHRASSHHARCVPRHGRSQFRVDSAMNRQPPASNHFRGR